MINTKTLQGLHTAFQDNVPGRAQRDRLLTALARVTGNKTVSSVLAVLAARNARQTKFSPESGCSTVYSGMVKAALVRYTRSNSDVNVTVTTLVAGQLLRELDEAAVVGPHATQLREALRSVLALRAG